MNLQNLPLFPLGTVLFPGSVLPLRIFEVRYLDMIKRCIEHDAPFGVVHLTKGSEVATPTGHETFAQVGTIATITEHDAPAPGLRTVRTLGSQRFRILKSERMKHGLWIADVTHLADDKSFHIPEELKSCATLLRTVLMTMPALARANLMDGAPSDEQLADCSWVANRWCQLLPIPGEMKQRLLELDSPLIRLELVNDLLDKLGVRAA